MSDVRQLTGSEIAWLIAASVGLPVLVIGLGHLFLRLARMMQRAPVAGFIAGAVGGVSNAFLLADSILNHKAAIALVFYGSAIVIWPVFGYYLYKAKKEQIEKAEGKAGA